MFINPPASWGKCTTWQPVVELQVASRLLHWTVEIHVTSVTCNHQIQIRLRNAVKFDRAALGHDFSLPRMVWKHPKEAIQLEDIYTKTKLRFRLRGPLLSMPQELPTYVRLSKGLTTNPPIRTRIIFLEAEYVVQTRIWLSCSLQIPGSGRFVPGWRGDRIHTKYINPMEPQWPVLKRFMFVSESAWHPPPAPRLVADTKFRLPNNARPSLNFVK